MWILPKPLLADALADIAKVIKANKGSLDTADATMLDTLYHTYDKNNGTVSLADNNVFSSAKQNVLLASYDKTQKGGKLVYIRQELLANVDYCPMCGIMPPSQLDHQMPKVEYKSLSVCRLNLVPTCGVCNNKKRTGKPSDFVHPYYDYGLRGIPFFDVEIHSNPNTHRMSWKFKINKAIIQDPTLADKVEKQIGVIKLFRRLTKEINILLSDILSVGIKFQEQLDIILEYEYNKYKRYGQNDWRVVFLEALRNSNSFTINEAMVYSKSIKPINGGVNA